MVFEDPRSRALLDRIKLVAPSIANVLIIGETGTGKELIARRIHHLSARDSGPFVAVNCGTFSENLVESELFGHERGAFTGALGARAGWFEAAQGGTLFLDEIGELPLHLQVKLLRVLQEQQVVRIGSRQPIEIDVRIVASTNIDPEKAVAAGRFRQDLYFRLNVATLRVAPLRERRGDLLPLALFFLREYSQRLGTNVGLSPEAEAHLLNGYTWPGNIRELENVIHHALIVCDRQAIRPSDLNLTNLRAIGSSGANHHPDTKASGEEQLRNALLTLFTEEPSQLHGFIEDTVIRTAYNFCHRNQVQTARLLGISRNIVRARLAHCGEISTSRSHPPMD
ncbi:MAG TPA: sigma-54 dependent transcriptional regulator [Chthoniobacterales bacterium]